MKEVQEFQFSAEIYKNLFDNTADAIFILNSDLRIIDVNQAVCDRLKYTKAELLEMTALDVNAPETRPAVRRNVGVLFTTGQARGEVTHVTKDGRHVPTEINSRLLNVNGEKLILTVARDISDQKATENELVQSRQHFRLLFDNSGTANSFYDLDGKIVLCNQLGSRLMGYDDPDALVGKSFRDLFGKQQGDLFMERLGTVISSRETQTHVTKFRVTSEEKWMQTTYVPLINEQGQVLGVQLVSQDITDQKRYENQLNAANVSLEAQVRERTNHLEAVLAQLQDAQSSIVENEKMAVLGRLSASVAHEVNTPLAAIQSSNGTIKNSFDSVLANLFRVQSSLSEEARVQFLELLSQSEANLRDTISAGPRATKRKLAGELEERNVPDSENVTEVLLQLGLSTLDVRWLPLLQHRERSAVLEIAGQIASLYRSTSIIATATSKATEFIRALRRFAYKETNLDTPEWFDLVANVETVLLLFKSQITNGIELTRNYEARPLVLGFPNVLLQVWSNLIQNALHAMDDNGILTVGIRTAENRILVEITDTGQGIPQGLREKIFEPFFTTKNVEKGTGLGLSIVTEALTQNRGLLEFDSVPGKTTFRASLPLESKP